MVPKPRWALMPTSPMPATSGWATSKALKGVVKFPVRIKCATLSWNTLAQALDEAASDT